VKPVHVGLVVCVVIGVALADGVRVQSQARADSSAASKLTAITGATVIGAGAAPIADAVIVLDGSRIAAVGPRSTTVLPANATLIDARGKFVIPGIADMHNHVLSGSFRVQQNTSINLAVLLASGVTTIFNPSVSLPAFADLKKATAAETAAAPRFFGTGPIVTVKGDLFGAAVGSPTPETAEDARTTIARLKGAGVDAIKVNRDDISWASSRHIPLMKLDVLSALIDEAHRQGLKVYAHAPLLDRAKEFLRAGGDGLLHGILDKPVDQDFFTLMQRNRAIYVPTLAMFEDVGDLGAWVNRQAAHVSGGTLAPLADSFKAPDFSQQFHAFLDNTAFTKNRLATLRTNLKRVFDFGIPVVMGTDSGFYGVMMGASSQMELALMVDAGLSPASALQSATVNAARMLGRDKESGTIEVGKVADVVVLEANPLDDIRNVARVFRVVRAGTVHVPTQLLSNVRFTAGRGRSN
jgi:imidazolonepropionase-like amidohydrolase